MSAPAQNTVDLDALLDLSEYDNGNNYHSPSLSPSMTSKPSFASPVPAPVTAAVVPTTSQTLSGPSHNYDMYRQQTGFVPGAIANTMAVNQTNNTGYQDFGSLDYLGSFAPEQNVFDFNTSPSQGAMDVDFDSAADSHLLNTVNPSTIEQESNNLPSPLSSSTSSVGRLWPGAHSQAALAKAQQKQQQHHMMQQQHSQRQTPQQRSRGKAPPATDPIVEQKITQLLNSMRAKASSPDSQDQSGPSNLPRYKKEEEEMDEDERLLASEEGKKLSSKERRQLRNKVSARAFRSRRKEYITQLEAEIANKVNENGDLRAQNRALIEENKRLSDLTRMLLASPSFSNFLDHLSSNPTAGPQPAQIKLEQPSQEQMQIPKDVNPYNGPSSQQQIGMAMVPEQTLDLSLMAIGNSAYNFQPQVFVVDTPDIPTAFDTSVLSGKASIFVEEDFPSGDEKMEIPALERPVEAKATTPVEPAVIDEEFESDPEFALFHSEAGSSTEKPGAADAFCLENVDLFGGIEAEKVLARYELVDATEDAVTATFALARVQSISAGMESVVSRLELLTIHLCLDG
ncbi:hypothetical protein RJ55_01061 [Drechmeria coniospora]|nr:hypothetical protein RJ55_01061 [Drechmeria coniospora]